MMGGDISVESELGGGSKFLIKLPVHVGDAETQARTPEASRPRISGSLQQAPLILVVDDDPTVREVVGRYLVARWIYVCRSGWRAGRPPAGA